MKDNDKMSIVEYDEIEWTEVRWGSNQIWWDLAKYRYQVFTNFFLLSRDVSCTLDKRLPM